MEEGACKLSLGEQNIKSSGKGRELQDNIYGSLCVCVCVCVCVCNHNEKTPVGRWLEGRNI